MDEQINQTKPNQITMAQEFNASHNRALPHCYRHWHYHTREHWHIGTVTDSVI